MEKNNYYTVIPDKTLHCFLIINEIDNQVIG